MLKTSFWDKSLAIRRVLVIRLTLFFSLTAQNKKIGGIGFGGKAKTSTVLKSGVRRKGSRYLNLLGGK